MKRIDIDYKLRHIYKLRASPFDYEDIEQVHQGGRFNMKKYSIDLKGAHESYSPELSQEDLPSGMHSPYGRTQTNNFYKVGK